MLYTDEGFVIKKNDLYSDDTIIHLFLKNKGKIAAIAKGTKRIVSKKTGNLEICNLCQFSLASAKTFDVITEVRLIDSYPHIREEQRLVFFLFYLDELINKTVYDGEVNEDIYMLLQEVLTYVNANPKVKVKRVLVYTHIKILLYSGVFPDFYMCIKCNLPIDEGDEKVYTKNGIAHGNCLHGIAISNNLIKVCKFIKSNTIEAYFQLQMDEGLTDRLFSLTLDMIEYTIGSAIRSKLYIHER